MKNYKILMLFMGMVFSIGLVGQPNIDSLLQSGKLKAGISFTSINRKVETSKKFYLTVVTPKFEIYYDTIKAAREIWRNKRIDLDLMTQVFEQKPAYLNWFVRTAEDTMAVKCMKEKQYEYEDFIMIGQKEEPTKYIVNEVFETFSEAQDTLYNEFKIIKKYRLLEESSIQIHNSKEEVNSQSTEIIEISDGEWQPFFEFSCPFYSGIHKIVAIQRALKRKGYSCKATGIFDSQTRAALIKFQQDINWVPSCRGGSGYLLLQKLGIKF